jgi:beta-phosphoglucomutase-like phosphatase (HAD superfamily)
MTTAAEQESPAEAPSTESPYALLFNLEGIAGSERQATYEVLVSVLGEQGLKLSPALMSRFCLGSAPESYLDDLLATLNASKQNANKLAEDVRSGIAMKLSGRSASLADGLMKILKTARDAGVRLAALSGLPQATATTLLESLGLGNLGVELKVMNHDNDEQFPRADGWLKLARSLSRTSYDCTVLAGSQNDAKSAVSAGMRCIAVPDAFTSFQDFSGANLIIDDLGEMDISAVNAIVIPTDD